MKEKKCKCCGIIKPAEEFSKKNGSPDGLQPWCKSCSNMYLQLGDFYKNRGGVKFCRRCRTFLPRDMFNANARHNDGLQSYCKVCDREHGRLRNGTSGVYREPTLFPTAPTEWRQTRAELVSEIKRQGGRGSLRFPVTTTEEVNF